MGRYDTRQVEVDRLFRGDRLVDLFQVVRQGLRASVESYSIKRLEPLYGFQRQIELRDAGSSIEVFERWLRMGGDRRRRGGAPRPASRPTTATTCSRRGSCATGWRSSARSSAGEARQALPRPEVKSGEADVELAGWLARVEDVAGPLRASVPVDERRRPSGRRRSTAERLLADLLGWHRREQKPDWWRYFHQLHDMTDEERLEAREPLAHAGARRPGGDDETGRTFRYRFPEQDHDLIRSRGHGPRDRQES